MIKFPQFYFLLSIIHLELNAGMNMRFLSLFSISLFNSKISFNSQTHTSTYQAVSFMFNIPCVRGYNAIGDLLVYASILWQQLSAGRPAGMHRSSHHLINFLALQAAKKQNGDAAAAAWIDGGHGSAKCHYIQPR